MRAFYYPEISYANRDRLGIAPQYFSPEWMQYDIAFHKGVIHKMVRSNLLFSLWRNLVNLIESNYCKLEECNLATKSSTYLLVFFFFFSSVLDKSAEANAFIKCPRTRGRQMSNAQRP